MSYTIRIRNNATGEIRRSQPHDFEWSEFWWTEGNMGCDCNRHAEWLRAGDEPQSTRECGDGAYTIIDATLEDGTVVPVENDAAEQRVMKTNNPGTGIIGERIGPEPKDEREYFEVCEICGQALDCRDLGQVLHHGRPDHEHDS